MTLNSRFSIEPFSIRTTLLILLIAFSAPMLSCADAEESGGEAAQENSASEAATMSVSEIPSIEPAELATRLQSAASAPLVLDVRTKAEFDAGHIPGALHIPYDELAGRLAEVDTTKGVAVHCMVGPRARKAEATLTEAGVDNILHLEGGYRAWMQAGLETAN